MVFEFIDIVLAALALVFTIFGEEFRALFKKSKSAAPEIDLLVFKKMKSMCTRVCS